MDTSGTRTAPRHTELTRTLRDEIEAGRWPVGGRFPTEADLQARFGVGRHTVRRALKALAEQGLISRRPKTGSVVTSDRPATAFTHGLRDMREIVEFWRTTRFDIEEVGAVTVDAASTPEPDEAGHYFRVAGLRYPRTGSAPLCWSEVLVSERYPAVREDMRAGHTPIYERALLHYHLTLDYVVQSVTATELSPAMARLLGAEGASAGLLVTRRYVETRGRVFELARHLYPGGRYVLASVFRER
ncbi:GntR family transcriptional regulator [Acuticoccus sp. I52.16.1]|uniref:GntR family transcriptional regulator n=1 Tax=Acuticoccus sp. I52.16.1 TaxID=2928472 RepID=UPI001FD55FC7|nr:GntR family transcriptional regulator [Acuticoccus sp. I52.16.1]UOM35330.1 GntR family transcriptional regulator [Acuticoccus sp. I52.16.1]